MVVRSNRHAAINEVVKMMYDWRVWVGSLVLSACWWLLLSTEINIVWDYYWAVWEGVMLTIGG